MRLTPEQIAAAVQIVYQCQGPNVDVRVYGSRLDDKRTGGDVDLLIVSPDPVSVWERAELKMQLEQSLQLPVDVLVYQQGRKPTAFQALALAQSVALDHAA
ncbi:MAG: nucleotidyltransferase domain-containing protein [Nitrosospira sp.]|nr:nucleotidyltransferase domain-containing protein [Nitrosospira sp.]MDN5936720.1 nucleotidyltransferase domain-containing protein [Nitrosospira sp.]